MFEYTYADVKALRAAVEKRAHERLSVLAQNDTHRPLGTDR